MKKEAKIWINLAEEDFENMQIMAKSKRLRGSVIFAQQSVEKINQTLKIFVRRLKKEFRPEKVLLFGSYASGSATEYSDIDLLIIAPSFEHLSFNKRLSKLHHLASDLSPDINALGFTPDEIQKHQFVTTLKDALKTGKPVLY